MLYEGITTFRTFQDRVGGVIKVGELSLFKFCCSCCHVHLRKGIKYEGGPIQRDYIE